MDGLAAPQGVVTQLSVNGLIAVTWAGAGLGILFTSARIVIRIVYVKRLLADDYFMLLALVLLITNAILQTLQAPHLYYIVLDMSGPDIVYHGLHYTYYEFAIIAIFWSVLWSVKASFLALFWMISNGLPRYRRIWWATAVFAALAYIGCWIASVYTCHPPSNYFKFGRNFHFLDLLIHPPNNLQGNARSQLIREDLLSPYPIALQWTSLQTY
jgi:hypothetical protein